MTKHRVDDALRDLAGRDGVARRSDRQRYALAYAIGLAVKIILLVGVLWTATVWLLR